ncbi:VCBS repeat-containing protein [Rhodopirellula sp. JC740]|uniref:VCBS repeat-containing protein n=1 Tax=Rhodopirellula halodulae TaxID=2894198 RepID=A0ABS8NEB9_9BACT|nr:VCBS repeat-containing protein [Rhodopirellula sp. JC740]MCC9641894.1 VCBS repeat-containing protein [Rhodopirellula sp. JC740]
MLLRPKSASTASCYSLLLGGILPFLGCDASAPVDPQLIDRLVRTTSAAPPKDEESIRAFCGDCHASPDPGIFEWDRWEEEVDQGFRLYRESLRDDLIVPDREATLAYYRDPSPKEYDIRVPKRSQDTRFQRSVLEWPQRPAISAVSSLVRLPDANGKPVVALTDMWTGTVATFSPTQTTPKGRSGDQATQSTDIQVQLMAPVAHASHIATSDLDGDGTTDYLVADLGTHNPQTEHEGNVWWLRPRSQKDSGETVRFDRIPLKLAMSRVADVRPIDYDGDGDQDLLVGDFGLHFEGGLHLGLNQGIQPETGVPAFEWEMLDERPGIIAIEVLDFDGDGKEDFLTLLTQHYEAIQWHRNVGDGTYETIVLHQADNPAYGSSSMEIVDLDQDGDLDVLATNGDTFDDSLAKPFHGIWWIENPGNDKLQQNHVEPFQRHSIGNMPGCYHAATGDFDGDGDLDIAATAWLSKKEIARYPADSFDGLVWFENLGRQSGESNFDFQRHTMEMNRCQAATLEVIDWNEDGRDDLLVPQSVMAFDAVDPMVLWLNLDEESEELAP